MARGSSINGSTYPHDILTRCSRILRRIDCSLPNDMTMPSASILKLSLEVRAERALKAAVKKAIAERARQGLPSYIWRDGKVVELSPEEVRELSEKSE